MIKYDVNKDLKTIHLFSVEVTPFGIEEQFKNDLRLTTKKTIKNIDAQKSIDIIIKNSVYCTGLS